METKKWYKSKTVLFNALTILVVVATVFGYTPNQELAENVTNILVALSPIINIGLRMVTKTPISG